MPARGPSGVMMIFATIGITAFGFYRMGLGNVEKRYVLRPMMEHILTSTQ